MKRFPRHRAAPELKRAKVAIANPRVLCHPLYGDIPLVRRTTAAVDGREHTYWQCDPQYEPRVPKGAVRGRPERQVFCYHHVPKYFYVDEPRTCVQCGDAFVFRAAEQCHWYEVLQFNLHSVPIRCQGCRRRRRTAHVLGQQVGRARAAVKAAPEDPDAWLALARAVVEQRQLAGCGRLGDAIAAARKAARLWPESSESLLWEGLAQHLAGRDARARPALTAYLSRRQGRPALLRMANAALASASLSGRGRR